MPYALAEDAPSLATRARPIELGIIIPTLNERANIGPMLDLLDRALGGIGWEAIFVDDDSADGTAAAVREIGRADPRVRVLQRVGRRGLSSAVVEGMLASSAPVLAVIDADMQHDERILPALFQAVAQGGFDLAIGSRYVAGGGMGEWAADRVAKSRLATRLAKPILKTPLSDPMSGFFVISRAAFEAALPRLSSIGFKILTDIVASAPGPLRAKEVPFTFRTRQHGESKLDATVAWEYVMLLLDKMVGRFVPVRFLLFAFVGGLGLIVDLGTLGLLNPLLGIRFAVAKLVSVFAAMTFNFALNNALTYRDRRLKGPAFARGLLSFYLVCSFGVLANVGVSNYVHNVQWTWWVAGVAGAIVGAAWNYAASSIFTWRKN